MENATESVTKMREKIPWITMFSKKYSKWTKELQEEDLNPSLHHFETGFDAPCAVNDHLVLTILDRCKQMGTVRTRLNSKNGPVDKEEALLIWEEAVKYVSKKVFPDHEEGDSVAMDHMWAMGNCSCLWSTMWKEWIIKTEEAIIERERLANL
eukprot:jgi/Psemu1/3403/gm1.3403_g